MQNYPILQPGDVITSGLMNTVIADLTSRTSDTGLRLGPLAVDTFTLVALGSGAEQNGGIWLDGQALLDQVVDPGISLVVLDSRLTLRHRATYNTLESLDASTRLSDDLAKRAEPGDIVAAVTHRAYLSNLDTRARAALAAVGGAGLGTPLNGWHNAAFIGLVPKSRANLSFDYLVSVMPADTQYLAAGLAFVWGVYSRTLRRFVLGGGAGGVSGVPAAPPPALTLVEFTVDPNPVVRGNIATATIAATGTASAATDVTLTNDSPNVATVPDKVTLPVGQNPSVTFPVITLQPGAVHVTASLANSPSRSVSLTVESAPPPPVTLTSLALDPKAVRRGQTSSGRVALSAAPTADITVGLASSHPLVAKGPPSLVIPSGQSSGTFVVTTFEEASTGMREEAQAQGIITSSTLEYVNVTITASLVGSTPRSDTLRVDPSEKAEIDAKHDKETKEAKDQKDTKDSNDDARNKSTKDNKDDKDDKVEAKEGKSEAGKEAMKSEASDKGYAPGYQPPEYQTPDYQRQNPEYQYQNPEYQYQTGYAAQKRSFINVQQRPAVGEAPLANEQAYT